MPASPIEWAANLPSFLLLNTMYAMYSDVCPPYKRQIFVFCKPQTERFILLVMIERNDNPVKGLFFVLKWLYKRHEGMSSPHVHEFFEAECLRGCTKTSIIQGKHNTIHPFSGIRASSCIEKEMLSGVYRISC